MNDVPHIPGVLTADEVRCSGAHLASLQLPSGMIPWFPGGHCDPWNHVESAMALDVASLHTEALAAYRWLADTQRSDGSWHNYYLPDGSIEDTKLDSNVCAYVATGVFHHWLTTREDTVARELWPTVVAALEWVLSMRRADGTILWAREVDAVPWDYALLTGSSSIRHALHCGAALGSVLGDPQPCWRAAADRLDVVIQQHPESFEPKTRWAMDWYYPVLGGALRGDAAKARLADKWDEFVMERHGVRCVSDEPWVTASETAECALAFAAIGDAATATDLLAWIAVHRLEDGSYYTGIVYPDGVRFPFDERTSYTAAAVVLAADGITAATPASQLFVTPV
ncbi:MAG: hypothetical protein WKF45_07385 [Ilumatobacteraceae bacterium]